VTTLRAIGAEFPLSASLSSDDMTGIMKGRQITKPRLSWGPSRAVGEVTTLTAVGVDIPAQRLTLSSGDTTDIVKGQG
jgi:hypothetical protein